MKTRSVHSGWGPIAQAREEGKYMDQHEDNRVLMRQGARDLDRQELDCVAGARHTATKCTFDPVTGNTDGDLGEC
jgi:hypothetical protein